MPNLPQFKHWPANLMAITPDGIRHLYEQGFRGAFKDPVAEEALRQSMPYATFAEYAHENAMTDSGAGKLSICFEFVQRLNPFEYPGKPQGTGCCVSRSTVNAFAASYSHEVWNGVPDDMKKALTEAGHDGAKLAEIMYEGKIAERWPYVPNPEDQTFDHVTIYGERGHRGQGANCSTLAAAARDDTGLLPRGLYDIPGYGKYDCSVYDDNMAARSGPRFPDAFRKFTNQHRVRDVTGVETTDEARDALANHYGLSVCSGFACRSSRPTIVDSKGNDCAGVNDWRGSWAHAMAWLACDDRVWAHVKYGGPLFLICNSWGLWNDGPRRIYDTDLYVPEGCMWIGPKDAARILRGGGAFAISNIKGFPRRPLTVSWW